MRELKLEELTTKQNLEYALNLIRNRSLGVVWESFDSMS